MGGDRADSKHPGCELRRVQHFHTSITGLAFVGYPCLGYGLVVGRIGIGRISGDRGLIDQHCAFRQVCLHHHSQVDVSSATSS